MRYMRVASIVIIVIAVAFLAVEVPLMIARGIAGDWRAARELSAWAFGDVFCALYFGTRL